MFFNKFHRQQQLLLSGLILCCALIFPAHVLAQENSYPIKQHYASTNCPACDKLVEQYNAIVDQLYAEEINHYELHIARLADHKQNSIDYGHLQYLLSLGSKASASEVEAAKRVEQESAADFHRHLDEEEASEKAIELLKAKLGRRGREIQRCEKKCAPITSNTSVNLTPVTTYGVTGTYGWQNVYVGVQLIETWGRVTTIETSRATGETTNRFTDSGDPLGVGILAGYNFRPWNNNVQLGPFASINSLNQTIKHQFTGGNFIGTTTHWIGTLGVKAGALATQNIFIYGLGGISWLNEDMRINLGGPSTSNNTTVSGFTLGIGGEYQPTAWKQLKWPVSLALQLQHTWWQNANVNNPVSSPGFNYTFKRQDNTIGLGVNVYPF